MNIKNILLLLRNVRSQNLGKGESLINMGSNSREVYFIRKGLFRSYLTDEKNDEITFQLHAENQFFTNIHTLLFNEPSKFTYQALEASKVYGINYSHFFELVSENPELMDINRLFLSKRVLQQAFQRVESFVFLSPEERYLKFVKDYPNIINRAPDKYIANILGITPVSLSRIRNRIASKKY